MRTLRKSFSIQESESLDFSLGRGHRYGRTAVCIKDIGRMGRCMGMEELCLLVGRLMRGGGETENQKV